MIKSLNDLWESEKLTVAGLMSGTSMDGIDAAVVRTDGAGIVEPISSVTIPYSPEFRRDLQSVLGGEGPV